MTEPWTLSCWLIHLFLFDKDRWFTIKYSQLRLHHRDISSLRPFKACNTPINRYYQDWKRYVRKICESCCEKGKYSIYHTWYDVLKRYSTFTHMLHHSPSWASIIHQIMMLYILKMYNVHTLIQLSQPLVQLFMFEYSVNWPIHLVFIDMCWDTRIYIYIYTLT